MSLTVGQNLQNWKTVVEALRGRSIDDLVAQLYPDGEPPRVRYLRNQAATDDPDLTLTNELMALLAAEIE